MLPNFLIIGAMKAGTTALYEYLHQHPQIFMAEPKELDFFVNHWNEGLGWYESHFEDACDAIAIGEASPNYTKVHDHPETPTRIAEVLPDARLIYIVRHPVERMISMYRHLVVDGVESRPIADAFLENCDYLNTSRYAYQLSPYVELFGRSQIHLIKSEDMRSDPTNVLQKLHEFLGVEVAAPPSVLSDANIGLERRQLRAWARWLGEKRPYQQLLSKYWRVREIHQIIGTRPIPPIDAELSPGLRRRILVELAEDMAEMEEQYGVVWL